MVLFASFCTARITILRSAERFFSASRYVPWPAISSRPFGIVAGGVTVSMKPPMTSTITVGGAAGSSAVKPIDTSPAPSFIRMTSEETFIDTVAVDGTGWLPSATYVNGVMGEEGQTHVT